MAYERRRLENVAVKAMVQEQELEEIMRDGTQRNVMCERSRRIVEKQQRLKSASVSPVISKSENKMSTKSASLSNLKQKSSMEDSQPRKRVGARDSNPAQKKRDATERQTLSVFDSLFEDSRKRQSSRHNSQNLNKTADKTEPEEFKNVPHPLLSLQLRASTRSRNQQRMKARS